MLFFMSDEVHFTILQQLFNLSYNNNKNNFPTATSTTFHPFQQQQQDHRVTTTVAAIASAMNLNFFTKLKKKRFFSKKL